MRATIIALAAGLVVAGIANAEAPINVCHQQRRIDAFVRSGKLTHGEAERVRVQRASITAYNYQLRAARGGKDQFKIG